MITTATMITMLIPVETANAFSRRRSRISRRITSHAPAHAATTSRKRSVSVGRSSAK